MGYRIADISNQKIVEVTVYGLLDLEIRQQILSKAFLKLLTTHYERLLLDIVNTFSPLNQTMTDALYLASLMKTIGFHQSIRLAFLYKEEEDSRLYFESTTLAQGFYLKYFKKKEQALDWLCNSTL